MKKRSKNSTSINFQGNLCHWYLKPTKKINLKNIKSQICLTQKDQQKINEKIVQSNSTAKINKYINHVKHQENKKSSIKPLFISRSNNENQNEFLCKMNQLIKDQQQQIQIAKKMLKRKMSQKQGYQNTDLNKKRVRVISNCKRFDSSKKNYNALYFNLQGFKINPIMLQKQLYKQSFEFQIDKYNPFLKTSKT